MTGSLEFEPYDGQLWPEVPMNAVAIVERYVAAGPRKMWVVAGEVGVYGLHTALEGADETWAIDVAERQFLTVVEALGSDVDSLSLRDNEITCYHINEVQIDSAALSGVLVCDGYEAQIEDLWIDDDVEYWISGDAEIQDYITGYECVPRWASINDFRVSLVKFDDLDRVELIPTIFEEGGRPAEALEVAELSFEEGNMGRPISYSFAVSLLRLRPGYAISLHEHESPFYAGDSHVMRLPIKMADEASAIAGWFSDMEEKHMVNYDEYGELLSDSDEDNG